MCPRAEVFFLFFDLTTRPRRLEKPLAKKEKKKKTCWRGGGGGESYFNDKIQQFTEKKTPEADASGTFWQAFHLLSNVTD